MGRPEEELEQGRLCGNQLYRIAKGQKGIFHYWEGRGGAYALEYPQWVPL